VDEEKEIFAENTEFYIGTAANVRLRLLLQQSFFIPMDNVSRQRTKAG